MDPNDNPYQPQPVNGDQQDAPQPTDPGQYDNEQLPPPDEIPADEHYLQMQTQPADSSPVPENTGQTGQPVPTDTQMQQSMATPADTAETLPLPPIIPAPQTGSTEPPPDPPSQAAPAAQPEYVPYPPADTEDQDQQPSEQQYEQTYVQNDRSTTDPPPADGTFTQPPEPVNGLYNQPAVPTPEPVSQPQNLQSEASLPTENVDNTAPPTDDQQQVPWWEISPAETEEEASYRDQLPPQPGDPGHDTPSIHNFKRRSTQDGDTGEPVQAAQPSSNLDFALPEAQRQTGAPTKPAPGQNEATDHTPSSEEYGPAPIASETPVQEPNIDATAVNNTGMDLPQVTDSNDLEETAAEALPMAAPTEQDRPQPPAAEPAQPAQPEHGTFQLPGAQTQTRSDQTPPSPPTGGPNAAAGDRQPKEPAASSSLKSKLLALLDKAKKINYKPMASAAIVGIIIFGVFNSQVIIGQVQYLTTPSGGLSIASGAVDGDAPVGNEPKIIIPRINVDVPVVYDEPSFDEDKVQAALERGVVHYGSTAVPGEKGNNVIVGHSSNNWWDSGKYKFAFILLDKLEDGDEIVLHYEGERYVYEVYKKIVIEPTNVSVLAQTDDPILTLITCTPPGTSWQRLVVQARQVSPDPSENVSASRPDPSLDAGALPSDSSGGGFFQFLRNLF